MTRTSGSGRADRGVSTVMAAMPCRTLAISGLVSTLALGLGQPTAHAVGADAKLTVCSAGADNVIDIATGTSLTQVNVPAGKCTDLTEPAGTYRVSVEAPPCEPVTCQFLSADIATATPNGPVRRKYRSRTVETTLTGGGHVKVSFCFGPAGTTGAGTAAPAPRSPAGQPVQRPHHSRCSSSAANDPGAC